MKKVNTERKELMRDPQTSPIHHLKLDETLLRDNLTTT